MSRKKNKRRNQLSQKARRALQPPIQPTDHATVQSQEFYADPIPPPSMLQQYEDIHPGFANRIMTRSEDQGKHRETLESTYLTKEIISKERGQNWAGVIVMSALAVAALAIIYGYPWVSGIIGPSGIGLVITSFIGSRQKKDDSKA